MSPLSLPVFTFCAVLATIKAACWFEPIKNETTLFGSTRFYCEYTSHSSENQTAKHGLTPRMNVTIGSKFDTLDCERCQCQPDGLHCCGTGYYGGVFQVPSACNVIPDGCEPIIVLATDHKLNCFTRKPVRPNQYGMTRVLKTHSFQPHTIRRVFHSNHGNVEPKMESTKMIANRVNSHWPEKAIENMISTNSPWIARRPAETSSSSRTVRVSSSSSGSDNAPQKVQMAWPISQDPSITRSISMSRMKEVLPSQPPVTRKPPSDNELNRMLAMKLLGLA